jgi:hypothetical protein
MSEPCTFWRVEAMIDADQNDFGCTPPGEPPSNIHEPCGECEVCLAAEEES